MNTFMYTVHCTPLKAIEFGKRLQFGSELTIWLKKERFPSYKRTHFLDFLTSGSVKEAKIASSNTFFRPLYIVTRNTQH